MCLRQKSQSHIVAKRIIFSGFQDMSQIRVQSNEFFSDIPNFVAVNLLYSYFFFGFCKDSFNDCPICLLLRLRDCNIICYVIFWRCVRRRFCL